ncbi:MAG TPA: EAL domain-containing protein [Solirubrobacteraceae bacterium]|nr:EAL domain-containing protein [Solirubrobacteraceae bacterium]
MPPTSQLVPGGPGDPAVAAVPSTLAHLAYHDPLTGLPNRTQLAERLRDALRRTAAGGGPVVLFSIDLDDFKLVNDGLGHAAGDELLRQLAARLSTVRRPGDVLARQGGDEFILLVELAEGDAATAAAGIGRRITEVLEAPFTLGEAELRIGASVGAALHPGDADDAETLHRHADWAMYRAKENGGGYAAYRPGAADPLERLSMAAALRRGLSEQAFSVHYQPVYRLADRGMMGVEALVRWNDPVRGPVSPAEFIPVAEKTGVIHAVGDWVLAEVCRQAVAWQAEGLRPNIGINVSPRQLQRPAFAEEFSSSVLGAGLDPSQIVVELTETAWMVDAARTLRALDRLAETGFVVALDDFGAGYSSLARLRRLPVGIIKIDRAFLVDLPGDPQAVAIVEAILALAGACGCDVVCEGVETEPQIAFLIERGCRLAQGFGLARPEPAAAVTQRLRAELVDARRSSARHLRAAAPTH